MTEQELIEKSEQIRRTLKLIIDGHTLSLEDIKLGMYDREGVVALYSNLLKGTRDLKEILEEQLDWMIEQKRGGA